MFGEVLELCAEAGLVHLEVIAVDGTKVHANASQNANRDYEWIAREILKEAAETDRVEDEQFGDRRVDELSPEWSSARGRRGWRATPSAGSMSGALRKRGRFRRHARRG